MTTGEASFQYHTKTVQLRYREDGKTTIETLAAESLPEATQALREKGWRITAGWLNGGALEGMIASVAKD